MKRYTSFVIKFLKNYEAQCPNIVNAWCSNETQALFNKLRHEREKGKKRCTCYILFCLKRRPELKEQYSYISNKEITSMIAKEWREHRDKKDDVYMQFKKEDEKQVFFNKHRMEICDKYPHLTNTEINIALQKMYDRIHH
jgi:hypothetical protein